MTEQRNSWDLPIHTGDMGGDFLGLTPKAPTTRQPTFRPPTPSPSKVPELEDLYQVQQNLLKGLQALYALQADNPDIAWEGMIRHVNNGYKTLNTWLKNHG